MQPPAELQEGGGVAQVLLAAAVVEELVAVAEEQGCEREVGRIAAVVQVLVPDAGVAVLVELAVLARGPGWEPYVAPRRIPSTKYPMRLPVRY